MPAKPLSILLVEDNPGDARLVKEALFEVGMGSYDLKAVLTLDEGVRELENGKTDLILLDLSLPDASGIETVRRARSAAPDLPIVVLTGLADEDFALVAMREGAQDYLMKGEIDGASILRSIRYAVERQAMLTERKNAEESIRRSEQYFRRLTESSLDLITVLDAAGTIIYESPSVASVLGYPPEDIRGRSAFEFVHPDDLAFVRKRFADAPASKTEADVIRFRFRHKDGSWRIVEGKGNNLLTDPVVRGIVFNSRDITEKRRLEEQLLQIQKVQAIGQLAGGVAHDFNNILTVVLGNCEIMMMMDSAPRIATENLKEIKEAAERGATLVHQLLAFSRKQILKPEILSFNSVVRSMDKLLHRLLGEQNTLLTRLEPAIWPVKADLIQIQQVLMNLAVNARDAMPDGGTLTIETRNVSFDGLKSIQSADLSPGEYALLSVTDTGVGMPDDVLARVFEPFFTTKEKGKGTGLGLATCHGIINQCGGHILVESAPGKGTCFSVYLPYVRGEDELDARLGKSPDFPAGHECVLFVEDDASLRRFGSTVLRKLGYQVHEASHGNEALNVLTGESAERVDLVVSDVIMPVLGGKELARKVAEISPGTKVLFVSGYAEDGTFPGGWLEPGVWFLPKPYSVESLARKVREVLDSEPV